MSRRAGKYKLGGPIINRSKVGGKCRVEKCRYYHVFLKDLVRHLEVTHNMTLASHKKLPLSLLSNVIKKNKGKDYMKYRKTDLCTIKGCKSYMQPLTDFTRHLRLTHGLTKKEFYAEKNKKYSRPCSTKVDWNEQNKVNRTLEKAVSVTREKVTPDDELKDGDGNYSDDERSDLLDSDATLSPFYPSYCNEED